MEDGVCKTCGAMVTWIRLRGNGVVTTHPVDRVPVQRIVIDRDGLGAVHPTYVSHFTTCGPATTARETAT